MQNQLIFKTKKKTKFEKEKRKKKNCNDEKHLIHDCLLYLTLEIYVSIFEPNI